MSDPKRLDVHPILSHGLVYIYIRIYVYVYIYVRIYIRTYVYVYRILKPVYSFLRPRTARAARRLAWQGGSFGQHGGAGGWPMMALP